MRWNAQLKILKLHNQRDVKIKNSRDWNADHTNHTSRKISGMNSQNVCTNIEVIKCRKNLPSIPYCGIMCKTNLL